MHPLDLVEAAPWRRVIFTTYALSLSFVEAILLDRLVRGGSRSAMILADPEGVRAGLQEQGARRAGRDYELEPVACTTGAFHPKLGLFFGSADAHMLVGSGNLTFGGWGVNLEVVEHVHPSFAAEAFDDAAEMFELMSISETIRSGVANSFESIAAELRSSAKRAPRNGGFRLLHSVGGSIGKQLADLAADLGGAKRLTVISPYFDVSGFAVSRLAERLDCNDVGLHVHPSGPVRGPTGTNWPNGIVAKSVCIDDPFGEDTRPLHAKCIEVICRRGRLLMSGSANATRAALESGNVEASLVRIQRETWIGWEFEACEPPVHIPPSGDEEPTKEENRIGVLRAVLEGGRIYGQVIEPELTGKAQLQAVFSASFLDLGNVELDASGKFECPAADLEMQTWSAGRMVLRVEQDWRIAEGFVSVTAAAELIRRAGPLAPSLFAVLAGTETPADVAGILSWYNEDPRRLLQSVPAGAGGHGASPRDAVWIPLETLVMATAEFPQQADADGQSGTSAWRRALDLVRAAFSVTRGPWASGTDQDDSAEDEEGLESEGERHRRLAHDERSKDKALDAFGELLDSMLDDGHQGRHVQTALALAHYLTDRIRPEPSRVQKWLQRIRNSVSASTVVDSTIASVAMLTTATDGLTRAPERARRFLLRNQIDPASLEIDLTSVPAFTEVLAQGWAGPTFLAKVREARTGGEQVRAYLKAADQGGPRAGYEQLELGPYWSKLSKALTDPAARSRILVVSEPTVACPKCNINMSKRSQHELLVSGVTRDCHLIMCSEV